MSSPRWLLSDSGHHIVKAAPLKTQGHSKIEQNGLHAVAITCITPRNTPCELHSTMIFPTRLSDPANPRGYLQVPLTFPLVPANPTDVQFDGVSVKFSNERGEDKNEHYQMEVVVSPSSPAVHIIVKYIRPRPLARAHANGAGVALVKREGGYVVHRVLKWLDDYHFQYSLTCLSPEKITDALSDRTSRQRKVTSWTDGLSLRCPNKLVSAFARFAKIRTSEAVFAAPNLGIVHSPGGGMFYSGVWCNDQAEYAAPIFPLLHGVGSEGRDAMLNSLHVLWDHCTAFGDTMPYSVEIDGGYVGRLDRGDMAMFAWGVSQFLFAVDDADLTKSLYFALCFACDILMRRITESSEHIVHSQSDELEGRFPSGDANFSVNCIAIMALEATSRVALKMNDSKQEENLLIHARTLRIHVHEHFNTNDEWKYNYYKGCTVPRGWICLGALAALPSGREALQYALETLWRDDEGGIGVRTSGDCDDVWDRCTLYAISAAFQNDLEDLALRRLEQYTSRRLLASASAPYAVENEESGAQLSAEGALFLRVVTHGILGLDLFGDRKFTMRIAKPKGWHNVHLENIMISGVPVTVHVTDEIPDVCDGNVRVCVEVECGSFSTILAPGEKLMVILPCASATAETATVEVMASR